MKTDYPTKPLRKSQLESWRVIVAQFRGGDSIRRLSIRYRFAQARIENMIRYFMEPGGR